MTLKRPDTVRSQPPLMLFAWQHNAQVVEWLIAAGWTPERIAETFPDVVRFAPGKTPPLLYKPATRDTCTLIPRDAVAQRMGAGFRRLSIAPAILPAMEADARMAERSA